MGHTDQADFLNTALRGETDLVPEKLLEFIRSAEKEIGRRQTFRWGPREIDIDIILYDNLQMKNEALTPPPPAFRERDFVLRPLSDLDPDLIDPATGEQVSRLLAKIAPEDKSIVD